MEFGLLFWFTLAVSAVSAVFVIFILYGCAL